ncbi:hypothetical protein [Lysinibacillus fusiformis]|uniref:hypothetical protein n=1 Tax=Lysinibacillus fusiformis TaxID=28031 RepID=UPI003D02C6D9
MTDLPGFDKVARAAYIGWLTPDQSRVPHPKNPHGWTAREQWDGEAWPTEPRLRAAIEAHRRADA